jgi:hypothetical protein
MVIGEIMLFKQCGGQSLVGASNIGLGRDPVGLTRIARATGLNIIMGASHYVNMSHPENMDSRSEEHITEKVVLDVTKRVDGTDIKSGVIGEMGCSWPLHHNERKALRASAKAQRAESGWCLEWDLFGNEYSYYKHAPPIDVRKDDIAWLISEGYGHKSVVLSPWTFAIRTVCCDTEDTAIFTYWPHRPQNAEPELQEGVGAKDSAGKPQEHSGFCGTQNL